MNKIKMRQTFAADHLFNTNPLALFSSTDAYRWLGALIITHTTSQDPLTK